LVARAQRYTAQWRVDDAIQSDRITALEQDLQTLAAWVDGDWGGANHALSDLMAKAKQNLGLEAEEMLVSILLEPFGDLIDDLADAMSAREQVSVNIKATVGDALATLRRDYQWALALDLEDRNQQELFWYVSEAKLEPRLGRRFEEDGADQEMPFDIAHQIQRLQPDLEAAPKDMLLAEFMLAHPQHRYVLKRVVHTARYPYGEIRDNLVAATTRPIDMLRCKLSFFGASKFDPKSDLWTRISLFQGAPLVEELSSETSENWLFAAIDLP